MVKYACGRQSARLMLDSHSLVRQPEAMDADEREVFDFLAGYGEEWVNAKEVCRRAGGKRRYNEDNNWARPILLRLKERRVLEGDDLGRFRVRPEPKAKGRWVSPDIEKILRESGVKADTERADAAADEHSEPL